MVHDLGRFAPAGPTPDGEDAGDVGDASWDSTEDRLQYTILLLELMKSALACEFPKRVNVLQPQRQAVFSEFVRLLMTLCELEDTSEQAEGASSSGSAEFERSAAHARDVVVSVLYELRHLAEQAAAEGLRYSKSMLLKSMLQEDVADAAKQLSGQFLIRLTELINHVPRSRAIDYQIYQHASVLDFLICAPDRLFRDHIFDTYSQEFRFFFVPVLSGKIDSALAARDSARPLAENADRAWFFADKSRGLIEGIVKLRV